MFVQYPLTFHIVLPFRPREQKWYRQKDCSTGRRVQEVPKDPCQHRDQGGQPTADARGAETLYTMQILKNASISCPNYPPKLTTNCSNVDSHALIQDLFVQETVPQQYSYTLNFFLTTSYF